MDYQKLDRLASDIYEYYYNLIIHSKKRQAVKKQELMKSLSMLSANEISYVKIKASDMVRETFGEKRAKL